MSKPPEDEDTFFQILEQIKQAITQSDVVEPEDAEIMDELEQGIRHSLEALMGMGNKEEPTITVMDGGISEDKEEDSTTKDSSEKTKPQLTLLPSAEKTEDDTPDDGWGLSNVQVRVVSGDSLFQKLGKSRRKQEQILKGLIALKKDESQVILRSEEKHLYRVVCLQGKMNVQSHFEILSLKEGQSLDIQTNQLVILAEEDSAGQYYKI